MFGVSREERDGFDDEIAHIECLIVKEADVRLKHHRCAELTIRAFGRG